jgi:5-methylcytosine-specific restriction protein A
MPVAPPKACRPGCPHYRGHCPTHDRAYDQQRGNSAERNYGHRWRLLRYRVLEEEPVCRICRKAVATEVDHILARAKGGTDDRSNLRGLCKACHSVKTIREDGGFRR